MSDAPLCPRCRTPTHPCFGSTGDTASMVLRTWYCVQCQWSEKAIGRERLITLEDWLDE